jgi:hypothetical protein
MSTVAKNLKRATAGEYSHKRPWTKGTIRQLLTTEKYIGNNVSFGLAHKSTYGSERNLTVRALELSDGPFPVEA